MAGQLLILSGPSGVGKDTVIDAWREVNPRVERVVAYTTREPRFGEKDGLDYHFVDTGTFFHMADRGEFLEHKSYNHEHYATPLQDLERMLAEGKIAILKIDVQGALEVMEKRPEAISVFLLPPSWEELEIRLRRRGTDPEDAIRRRLTRAEEEMDHAERYEHQITNDDLDRVVRELEAIVA